MTAVTPDHDELVATMTGGMVPRGERPFAGSDLLRPDGRPRPEFRAELRRIQDMRNVLTVLSVLAVPIAVVWAVMAVDRWWAVPPAIAAMGIVQNRLYILHHEAAHRLLFSNRRINDVIGVNILGWLAFGTGTHHYRRGHANHHRDEFGPNEPDFLLYAFYPIVKASFRRKLRRDLTGVSAYRIMKPRFTGLRTDAYLRISLRFFAGQILVITLFVLAGAPLLYIWLWLVPYLTWYQIQNRLRSIAEHGGMTRSGDRRDTTHHVEQTILARLFMVPYGVGYHLAHHVDSGVPFRNLPRLHQALHDAGYLEGASLWPSYTALWRALSRG
ncbi:MAG: fatty acid desaturase family protein [Acidimicrobiales bacterium]